MAHLASSVPFPSFFSLWRVSWQTPVISFTFLHFMQTRRFLIKYVWRHSVAVGCSYDQFEYRRRFETFPFSLFKGLYAHRVLYILSCSCPSSLPIALHTDFSCIHRDFLRLFHCVGNPDSGCVCSVPRQLRDLGQVTSWAFVWLRRMGTESHVCSTDVLRRLNEILLTKLLRPWRQR